MSATSALLLSLPSTFSSVKAKFQGVVELNNRPDRDSFYLGAARSRRARVSSTLRLGIVGQLDLVIGTLPLPSHPPLSSDLLFSPESPISEGYDNDHGKSNLATFTSVEGIAQLVCASCECPCIYD